ncbi:MAG: dethiobiotin synthase [Deltaproteobacteria bacterium]|nr:dethiobiotin synthase [Deltaproteobacteria bacterium]
MRALFVTGTDTGCGKTSVACALARTARAAGLRVRVLKPVETGCEEHAGERVAADARALAEAAGDTRGADALCPYRLALPAAPEIAARREGVRIDPERLDAAFTAASNPAAGADLLLVEGAGGLLVPIGDGLDMAGLAARWKLPLLVVARASLGTINHTLLTLEAARARGSHVAALVFSHTQPELSAPDRENLDLLLADPPVATWAELGHGERTLDLDAAALVASLPGT